MNYEQKYNEVLQKAKEEYNRLGELGNESMKRRFEIIFPELAESEDERIRKTLLDEMAFLKEKGQTKLLGIDINDIIAYLEKQKEQKVDIDKLRKDIYQSGYNDGYQHGEEDAQKEQKPAELGEEDEKTMQDLIDLLWIIQGSSNIKPGTASKYEKWLKSLRPKRVNVSDQTLQLLICYLYGCHDVAKRDWEKADCRRYISYLEDLDYTLKNKWKPSEEQMEALQNAEVLVRANNYPENAKILAELYEQLKAL